MKKILVILMVVISNVYASEVKDLGTYGETFPVKEKSLLEVIRKKLQKLSDSGQLEHHQEKIVKLAKQKIQRPEAVTGIVKVKISRTFTYDPSITVPYDLKDHKDQIFHKKGTRVNPLETHSMRCSLLFIDGDDPDQVSWAKGFYEVAGENHKPKVILVKGSPLELSETYSIQ
ncbi:MAG: hypothetical protein K2X08_04785, partial [Chlamydiales bacterium]|nr:hypothetical protein [Chlamydiales bacterium]